MNASTTRWTKRNIIGRLAMVKADGVICTANIIDRTRRNISRRVRLQTGEHAGEVRAAKQYELLEFIDCGGSNG